MTIKYKSSNNLLKNLYAIGLLLEFEIYQAKKSLNIPDDKIKLIEEIQNTLIANTNDLILPIIPSTKNIEDILKILNKQINDENIITYTE